MKYFFIGVFFSVASSSLGQIFEGLIQAEYIPKAEYAEGHPYLFEEYSTGNVKISSGTEESVLVRYNLVDNNLIASLNGKEFILKKDIISAFTLNEKANGKTYNFVPIRIGNKDYFVELLYDNNTNTKFVKWYRKQFVKGQPQPGYAAMGNSPDRFEQVLMYMFIIDGKTLEYSKKKNDLVELLSQGDAALRSFLLTTMKAEKLKSSEENDVISLLQKKEEYVKNNSSSQ